MRISCPSCRLIVRVTKSGNIGKHNVAGPRIIATTCHAVGMAVMQETDAHDKYVVWEINRRADEPHFTFSGWLAHNRIHAI